MNDVLLTKIASVGSVFLLWHFLTLILCLTGLLLEGALRKGNPHVRSTLLRLTLLVALAVPVLCLIWNTLPPASVKSASSLQEIAEPYPAQQTLPNLSAINWDHVAVWRPMVADMGQLQNHLVMSTGFGLPLMQIFYATLLGVSSLVSFCLLIRLVLAVFHCVALRQRGKPLEASKEARCQIIASAMGAPIPQLLEVNGLKSPVLLGFFKPAILLPDCIEARDEIYGHELTHLRRHDLWWHLFARLATILMPLQPGFWLLMNALARADEDVCDDMVLMQGANRSTYAELLLKVAEAHHSPCPDLCLSMAAFRSQLEHRLHRLMDTARPLASSASLLSVSLFVAPLLFIGALASAIYLDAERPLHAEDNNAPTASPKVDYAPFLVRGSEAEKEAYAGAFKAADTWFSLLDEHRYTDAPAPDRLNDKSISPQDWQKYLAEIYSGLGEIQSRQLKMVMRGWATGADASKMTNLTLTYKTSFKMGEPLPAKAEQLQLSHDSEGKWRVREFSMPTYAFVNDVTMSEAEAKSQ